MPVPKAQWLDSQKVVDAEQEIRTQDSKSFTQLLAKIKFNAAKVLNP